MRRCDDATIKSYRDIKNVYVLIFITLLFLLLLYEINGRIVASSHQNHSGCPIAEVSKKKTAMKFGQLENFSYLCTRFYAQ
jgi:hypothetical protein